MLKLDFFLKKMATELVEAQLIEYAKKEGCSQDDIIDLIICNEDEIHKFIDQMELAYILVIKNWMQNLLSRTRVKKNGR